MTDARPPDKPGCGADFAQKGAAADYTEVGHKKRKKHKN
jgi:hypothetical protein